MAAHEAILRPPDLQGRSAGIFDCRRTVFPGQGKDSQDAANACFTLSLIDGHTQYADLISGVACSPQQLRGAQRHFLWVVVGFDAIPAAFLADVLAEKLIRAGIENAHVQRIPLHFDESPDPPGWQSVIGRFNFHTAIEMNDAFSILVVAEGFERQCLQRWFFFGEHRCDLSFRRAVDARIRRMRFTTIEMRLRFFQTFEAQSFERRFLGVSDARLHFPFAIGILDPARHGYHAVVCEHVPKKWVERGIVDVRNDDSLAQIVENHQARTPSYSTKGLLMQLCPHTRTRTPYPQT